MPRTFGTVAAAVIFAAAIFEGVLDHNTYAGIVLAIIGLIVMYLSMGEEI